MNNKPTKNPFWYVFGPLVIYWIVGLLVSIGAACVLVIGNVNEFANVLDGLDANNSEAVTAAMQQCTLIAMKLEIKYAVEIQSVKAICSILACSLFFFKDRKREKEQETPQSERVSWSKYVYLFVFAIAYNIGISCLSYMIQLVVGDSGYQSTSAIFYSAPLWLQIIGLCILVPIMEELLFRGVIYKRLREKNPFFRAALSSAILFSLLHSNTTQIISAFLLGMILAYVYEKYGSFKAPAFTHVIVNLTAILGTNTEIFDGLTKSPEGLGIAVVVCTFVAAVMFTMIQRINSGFGTDNQSDSKDDSQKPNLDMFR